MKIPYFCCIGAELKRYQKDFDFMNQVYLYKVPTDDTIDEVLAEDYFKAISDTVLQDDIVYIYETASQKIHVCRFDKENRHITVVKLTSGIPELEPDRILVSDQNGSIASSDISLEYIKDTLSILHCTVQLSDTVDTTTVVMLDELDAFEHLDSRPSYKAPGAIVVDNFGNRGIIESVDQENQTAAIITIYTAVKSINGRTGEVILTGEDISADVSEQTDTVQGHLQTLHDNIKDIELFKFPNATIIGEPIIQNGQVSGFTAENYLQFPFILDLHDKPFVIDFCFTTGNDVITQQNILDSQFGLALAIANGKGLMAISHNGTSWAGSIVGTLDIQPNTTYYARLSWNRILYQTQLSTDGTTYTPDMNFGSTQSPYPRTMFIGGCSGSAIGHTPHPFSGTINMNYAYLTVDGNIIWQGMDDAGLATRADISLDNLDEIGQAKFDAKQNKLIPGANITIDEDTNTISATGGGSGRNIGDIFYTTRMDAGLNGAVECDGGAYSTEDYEGQGSIGELLRTGKLPYVSLYDYATQIINNGVCGVFGWDGAGTTDFRVPTLRDVFIECSRVSELGDYISAGLPNITATWAATSYTSGSGTSGAAYVDGTVPTTANGGDTRPRVRFDASRSSTIYGNSTTVQPESVKYRAMIQLFNSTTDQAVATVGTVVAQVGELRNMSNITATGKETVVGWGMPDYSAVVSMSSGSSAPTNGWAVAHGKNATVTYSINGVSVAQGDWASGAWSGNWNLQIMVSAGDIVAGGSWKFIPCKGA